MPISTIHVLEGRYDERRLRNVSAAVKEAAINILKVTSDDVFLIVHELTGDSNANGGAGGFRRMPSGRDSPKTLALAALSTAA